MREIPADMQEVFVTAHDLTWEDHVNMQATLQMKTEQSISKTINLQESATVEDVSDAFWAAWELDCKGATVYRDGSRQGQVLTTKHKPTERPRKLNGETAKYRTDCGSLYVTVNRDTVGDVHEVFANHSKRNGCIVANLNSLARVTSIALRAGVDPEAIAKALRGQVCGYCEEDSIESCPDAVGRALMPEVCTIGGECQTCQ